MSYDSYGGYDPLEAMRSRSQVANPYVDTPAPPEPAAGGAPQPPASPTTSPQQAALRTVTSPFRYDRRFSRGVSAPYYAAAGVGGVTDTGQLQPAPREPNAYPGVQAPAAGSSGTGASSSWDTDGYAAPAWIPEKFAPTMAGRDPNKWADPNHQTPKYVVSRILSNYQPTTQGLQQALGDLRRAYPQLQFDGKDKIKLFPNGEWIDVLGGASVGGTGWRFGTESHDAAVNAQRAAKPVAGSGFLNRFTPTQAEQNPHASLLGWLLSQYLGV